MKAWQFVGTHRPLERADLPDPVPGVGEVAIDVKAAGLCHSDVGILEDEKWLSIIPELPRVPGHEIAGVIYAVGEGVADYGVGDRVAVWPMNRGHGYFVDGGFGEKVIAHPDGLLRIPDGVSFPEAAMATDAGMTSHGAVIGVGEVKRGERVGIIGFGGLGQIGARIATLNGAHVFVAEINERLWPRALEFGAEKVAKDIRDFASEELDVIVDFAGFGTTTAGAIETVGAGGRVVQVGMGALEATINTYALITNRVQLRGNNGGSKDDIASVLDWLSKGEIRPVLEHITHEDIPSALDRLRDGTVAGRLVVGYP